MSESQEKLSSRKRILVFDIKESTYLAIKKILEDSFNLEAHKLSKKVDFEKLGDLHTIGGIIFPWGGRHAVYIKTFLAHFRNDWRLRGCLVGVLGNPPEGKERYIFECSGVHEWLGSPTKKEVVKNFKEKILEIGKNKNIFNNYIRELENCLRNGDAESAIRISEAILGIDKRDWELNLIIAKFLEEQGEDKKAEQIYRKVVKENSKFLPCVVSYSVYLTKKKRFKESKRLFDYLDKWGGSFVETLLTAFKVGHDTSPRNLEVQQNSAFDEDSIFTYYQSKGYTFKNTVGDEEAKKIIEEFKSKSKIQAVFKEDISEFLKAPSDAGAIGDRSFSGNKQNKLKSGVEIDYIPTIHTPKLSKASRSAQRLNLLPPVLTDQPGSIIRNSIFQVDRTIVNQADSDLVAKFPGFYFGCYFPDDRKGRDPMSKITEIGITHIKKGKNADQVIEWIVSGEMNFLILHLTGNDFEEMYRVLRISGEARGFKRPLTLLLFEDKSALRKFASEAGWLLYDDALFANAKSTNYEAAIKKVIFSVSEDKRPPVLRDRLRKLSTRSSISETDSEKIKEILIELNKSPSGRVWASMETLYLDMHQRTWNNAAKTIGQLRKLSLPLPEAEKNASLINMERYLDQSSDMEKVDELRESESRRLYEWIKVQEAVSSQDYFSLGKLFLEWGQLNVMSDFLEHWSNREGIPTNSKFHLLASCYCMATGQPKEAKLFAFKALQESPKDVGAIQHLCCLLEMLNEDKSIKELWKCLALLPGHDQIIYRKGYIKTLMKIDKEKECYQELEKLKKANLMNQAQFEMFRREVMSLAQKKVV